MSSRRPPSSQPRSVLIPAAVSPTPIDRDSLFALRTSFLRTGSDQLLTEFPWFSFMKGPSRLWNKTQGLGAQEGEYRRVFYRGCS